MDVFVLLEVCWGIPSYSKAPADSLGFSRTSKSCSRASFLVPGPVLGPTGVLSGSEGVLPKSWGLSGPFQVLQGLYGWGGSPGAVGLFLSLSLSFPRAPRPVLPCEAAPQTRGERSASPGLAPAPPPWPAGLFSGRLPRVPALLLGPAAGTGFSTAAARPQTLASGRARDGKWAGKPRPRGPLPSAARRAARRRAGFPQPGAGCRPPQRSPGRLRLGRGWRPLRRRFALPCRHR